jgi:hypothetical protein
MNDSPDSANSVSPREQHALDHAGGAQRAAQRAAQEQQAAQQAAQQVQQAQAAQQALVTARNESLARLLDRARRMAGRPTIWDMGNPEYVSVACENPEYARMIARKDPAFGNYLVHTNPEFAASLARIDPVYADQLARSDPRGGSDTFVAMRHAPGDSEPERAAREREHEPPPYGAVRGYNLRWPGADHA